MNFSIAATISRLFAPRHELSCSWFLWRRLTARLRERGRHANPRKRRVPARLPGARPARADRRLRSLRRSRPAQPRHRDHPLRRQAFRQALGDLPRAPAHRRRRRPCASGRLGSKRFRQGASDGDAGGPYRTHHAALRARADPARGDRHLSLSRRPSLADRAALRSGVSSFTSDYEERHERVHFGRYDASPGQAGDGRRQRAAAARKPKRFCSAIASPSSSMTGLPPIVTTRRRFSPPLRSVAASSSVASPLRGI